MHNKSAHTHTCTHAHTTEIYTQGDGLTIKQVAGDQVNARSAQDQVSKQKEMQSRRPKKIRAQDGESDGAVINTVREHK